MAQGRKVVPIGGMPVAIPGPRDVNLAPFLSSEVPMGDEAVDNAALQWSKALEALAPEFTALWQQVEESKKKGSGKRAALAMNALQGKFGFPTIQRMDREEAEAWFQAEKKAGRFNEVPYNPTIRLDDWLNFKVLAGKRQLANSGVREEFLGQDVIDQFSDPAVHANALEEYITEKVGELTEDMHDKESAPYLLGFLSELKEGPNALIPQMRRRVETQKTKNAATQFTNDAVGAARELLQDNYLRGYLGMKASAIEEGDNEEEIRRKVTDSERYAEDLKSGKLNFALSISELLNGPPMIGNLRREQVLLHAIKIEALSLIQDDPDGDFEGFIEFIRDIPHLNRDAEGLGDNRGFLGENSIIAAGLQDMVGTLQAAKNRKNAPKGVSTPESQGELMGLLGRLAHTKREELKDMDGPQLVDWFGKNAGDILDSHQKRTGLRTGAEFEAIKIVADRVASENAAALNQTPGQKRRTDALFAKIQDEGSNLGLEKLVEDGGLSEFGIPGLVKLRDALAGKFNILKGGDAYKSTKSAVGNLIIPAASETKYDAETAGKLIEIRNQIGTALEEKVKSLEAKEGESIEDVQEAFLSGEAMSWAEAFKRDNGLNDKIETLKKQSLIHHPASFFARGSGQGDDVRTFLDNQITIGGYKGFQGKRYDADLGRDVADDPSAAARSNAIMQITIQMEKMIPDFLLPNGKDGAINADLNGLNDMDTRSAVRDYMLEVAPKMIHDYLGPKSEAAKVSTVKEVGARIRSLRSRFDSDSITNPKGKSAANLADSPANFGGGALPAAKGPGKAYNDTLANYRNLGKELGAILDNPASPQPTTNFVLELTRALDNPGTTGFLSAEAWNKNVPGDLQQQVAFLSLYLSDPERFKEEKAYFNIETDLEDFEAGVSAFGGANEANRQALTENFGYLLMLKGVSIKELKKDTIATGGISLKNLWKDENGRVEPWQIMPVGPHGKVNDIEDFGKWLKDAHYQDGPKAGKGKPVSEWSKDNPYAALITDVLQIDSEPIHAEGFTEDQTEINLFWTSQTRVRQLRDRAMKASTEGLHVLRQAGGFDATQEWPEDRMPMLHALDRGLETFPGIHKRSKWVETAIENSKAFNK